MLALPIHCCFCCCLCQHDQKKKKTERIPETNIHCIFNWQFVLDGAVQSDAMYKCTNLKGAAAAADVQSLYRRIAVSANCKWIIIIIRIRSFLFFPSISLSFFNPSSFFFSCVASRTSGCNWNEWALPQPPLVFCSVY